MIDGKHKRNPGGPSVADAPRGFHSLLVPVDLTPSSDRVLGRLARLPLARGAHVTLLHVVPDTLTIPDQRSAQHDAKKALREEARVLSATLPAKVRVEVLVKVGSTPAVIATAARAAKAELVVMGRGGARALRDVFLGSTAERVIRRGQLPVLVVRLPPRKAYRYPALALDLDQAAKPAVAMLLRVIAPPALVVRVIHAVSVPYQSLAYPSLPSELGVKRSYGLQQHASQQLGKLLGKAVTHAEVPPAEAPIWDHHVRVGSPHTVIQKAVKSADTDLLVLGTHGRAGLAHVFLGTVAGDVLRDVACDVLVVPPPHKATKR